MIVLTSFTPIDAGGGVPRFNRDLMAAFPSGSCVHYSWWDVCKDQGWSPEGMGPTEWDKAVILNQWLKWTKRVTEKDVIISDSFWAAGLENLPYCVSHQHGNWSHTTLSDAQKGIPPEFPYHAARQLDFRKKYVAAGQKLTAVSDFIADQMKLQWGFDSTVINNGIDTSLFTPAKTMVLRDRPIIIHFVTTSNKGFDHIEAVKRTVDADVWLLDEAAQKLGLPKYEALAQANLVVHPSAHEGNSYAVLETLSCGVPIVSYDVGLMYRAKKDGFDYGFGSILDRDLRHPNYTAEQVQRTLSNPLLSSLLRMNARMYALQFGLKKFHENWRTYLRNAFPDADIPG